eukprot:CAMPEP_0197256202 /NCGR_PEP_ID=MMETSP1429-20130617/74624_1 /TAXON_ID=49237 /ORGANISM="Chaetoceros  sp., Strain UNC1202" /LENGTH=210 /DNA_ID=CAMNT_0042719711 /DNA_START=59 /DNA_END=691 /DNA_ORIENTATION=-
MKMNQSRKINHKEVLSEGERLGSKQAERQHRKSTQKQQQIRKEQEWNHTHSKSTAALASTSSNASTAKEKKIMMQSGSDSIRQAHKHAEKTERNMYSTNDYYNPEGQFRNYERSLQVVQSSHLQTANRNPDEIVTMKEQNRERNGAKRLANEMKRRAQKTEKRKQKQMDFEAEDVSYINNRNKKFNEKISRNYDKHTAEIKQNLERGTAL